MKKSILFLIFIILTAGIFAGCTADDLAKYMDAVNKTDEVSSGQQSIVFTMQNEFDKSKMKEADIKAVDSIKEIVYEGNLTYSEECIFMNNYIAYGGTGHDYEVYIKDEAKFMKIPAIGKYIDLNDTFQGESEITYGKDYEEAIKVINNEWVKVLSQENVVSGSDIVLETKDGDVKAKQFTININNEQFHEFIDNVKEKDPDFFNNFVQSKDGEVGASDVETVDFNELLEHAVVENFTGEVYIDADGFIIEESFTADIKIEGSQIYNTYKTGKFTLIVKNWSLNREQEIVFPEISEEDILEPEALENMNNNK